MNRGEVLAMEAGSKLDFEVALEVMGIAPYRAEPYSTDISVAWQVVDKMISSGKYFCLQRVVRKGRWLWEANFGSSTIISRVGAPEAICKAALLAKLAKSE